MLLSCRYRFCNIECHLWLIFGTKRRSIPTVRRTGTAGQAADATGLQREVEKQENPPGFDHGVDRRQRCQKKILSASIVQSFSGFILGLPFYSFRTVRKHKVLLNSYFLQGRSFEFFHHCRARCLAVENIDLDGIIQQSTKQKANATNEKITSLFL